MKKLPLIFLLLFTLSLGGCGLGSKGTDKALFRFPPDKRILVLVDESSESGADLDDSDSLGQALTDHLFQYKATTDLVNQERMVYLRRTNALKGLSIAEVAKKTQADMVLYVQITLFKLDTDGDSSVYTGQAVTSVKVVGNDGKHLWPGDLDDPITSADVPEDRQFDRATAKNYLIDLLAVRIGRKFHDYSLDDPYLSR